MDTRPRTGGLRADERFFPHGDDWQGPRSHQVRLQAATLLGFYCFR